MANTLTALIPSLYASMDVVSRELVGFIPSIALDASAARAAVGQQVLSPITPSAVAEDITPGVTAPNDGDQVIGNNSITIAKSRGVPFRWNGEEQLGLDSGAGYAGIRNDQITQAMRTLCNEIEAYVAGIAYQGASRATGTAGTTPFATALGDPAQTRKILSDNGSPMSDIHLTIDTTSGAALRTLSQLTKANEAGDTTLLRQGVLLDIHGFAIRESAGVAHTTKGTGTGYVVSGGAAAGATSVPLITGAGTVVAGDVVTFAGDSNKYVVGVGIAAPGTITINKPGLLTSLAANAAMTIGNGYTANLAYQRNAIVLATRAPAMPIEGDSADDRTTITDPRSGLSFEVALYKQYKQVRYELSIAYGAAVMKQNHIALLMG